VEHERRIWNATTIWTIVLARVAVRRLLVPSVGLVARECGWKRMPLATTPVLRRGFAGDRYAENLSHRQKPQPAAMRRRQCILRSWKRRIRHIVGYRSEPQKATWEHCTSLLLAAP